MENCISTDRLKSKYLKTLIMYGLNIYLKVFYLLI